MDDIGTRIRAAIYEESAAISPHTSPLIEVAREAVDEIKRLRLALEAVQADGGSSDLVRRVAELALSPKMTLDDVLKFLSLEEAKPMSDVKWVLDHLTEDADICSKVNGSDDAATKEARRIEVTVKRLARERADALDALRAIAGDIPWPDADKGFVDLARYTLSITHNGETE